MTEDAQQVYYTLTMHAYAPGEPGDMPANYDDREETDMPMFCADVETREEFHKLLDSMLDRFFGQYEG